jgi:hypothetical protein
MSMVSREFPEAARCQPDVPEALLVRWHGRKKLPLPPAWLCQDVPIPACNFLRFRLFFIRTTGSGAGGEGKELAIGS